MAAAETTRCSTMEADTAASERMSAADHLMWIGDRDPALRSTVVSVAVFDGEPSANALEARYERMSHAVLRLRQRVRANPMSIAPPRWELDPHFDLANHVSWIDGHGTHDMDDVLAIAAAKALEPFPTQRPLWEATAVAGLPGDRFALIQKVHHAITDGINGVKMQLELFDFEPQPQLPAAPGLPDHIPLNQVERMGDAVRWDLRRRADSLAGARRGMATMRQSPTDTAGAAVAAATSLARLAIPAGEPLSSVLRGRSHERRFATLTLPMVEAKAAGHAAGTKLNAVFLAGLSVGLASYHRSHDVNQAQLRLGIPISTRTGDSENNAFVGTRFLLPLVYDDIPSLLRTTQQLVTSNAAEPALGLLPALGAQVTRLPTPVATRLFRSMMGGLDLQASNVPGSPLPMYLLGRPLLHQFPFGPTTTAALNVTLLSYVDQLDLGVAMNTGAVDDPDELIAHLSDGFDEVLAPG